MYVLQDSMVSADKQSIADLTVTVPSSDKWLQLQHAPTSCKMSWLRSARRCNYV